MGKLHVQLEVLKRSGQRAPSGTLAAAAPVAALPQLTRGTCSDEGRGWAATASDVTGGGQTCVRGLVVTAVGEGARAGNGRCRKREKLFNRIPRSCCSGTADEAPGAAGRTCPRTATSSCRCVGRSLRNCAREVAARKPAEAVTGRPHASPDRDRRRTTAEPRVCIPFSFLPSFGFLGEASSVHWMILCWPLNFPDSCLG